MERDCLIGFVKLVSSLSRSSVDFPFSSYSIVFSKHVLLSRRFSPNACFALGLLRVVRAFPCSRRISLCLVSRVLLFSGTQAPCLFLLLLF